jgi:hypothetical protein
LTRSGINPRRGGIDGKGGAADHEGIPSFLQSTMARLTLHTPQTAPEASRPFVERALAGNGFLPNLIAILANSPQALEVVLGISLAALCNFANSLAQSPVNPQLQPYLPEQFRQPQENAHAG